LTLPIILPSHETSPAAGAAPALLASSAGRSLPAGEMGHAEFWLRAVRDDEPTDAEVRAIETYLISTIDHGFNNSTFSARSITSTGCDVAGAVCGAIGSFSGPLHGGAPGRALEMIESIGDPANAERWLKPRLDSGEKVMGFGHAVYRADDPRAMLLRDVALGLGGELIDRAVEIEAEVLAVLRAWKPNATIVTNVEYYAGRYSWFDIFRESVRPAKSSERALLLCYTGKAGYGEHETD